MAVMVHFNSVASLVVVTLNFASSHCVPVLIYPSSHVHEHVPAVYVAFAGNVPVHGSHDTLPFQVVPLVVPSYPVMCCPVPAGQVVRRFVLLNVSYHMSSAVGEPFAIRPANVDGGI